MREQPNEYKLVPAIVLHPEDNAFVIACGTMKTLLAAPETFQFAPVCETPMGIRESVYEEASHQLVAIWSGRHGTETVGNRMHQEIADTASISPKQTHCGAWNLLASFKNGKRGKSNVRKPYVVGP
jgi:hypothetical protein